MDYRFTPTVPRLLGRILIMLLGLSSLNACQRASYYFPKVRGAAAALVAPEIVVAEAGVETTMPELAPLSLRASRTSQLHPPARQQRLLSVPHLRRQPTANRQVAKLVASPLWKGKASATVVTDEVPLKQRSRALAILLAVLAITYLPLSLHNFYLGYYGRGATAIALLVVGTYLLLLGTVGFLTVSSSLTAIGYVGLAICAGWFLWQVADLIRIITGDLKPKNGEYKLRKARP